MIPAGGSKCWSKTAEEAFSDLLSRPNRNFMVKIGEELDGSLPVDIMMEEVHEAGALEPMRKEYKSVREALKEMGYGFISKKSRVNTESAAESAGTSPSSKLKAAGDVEATSSSEVKTTGDGDTDAPKRAVVSENVTENVTPSLNKDTEQEPIKVESVPDEVSHSGEAVSAASSVSSEASEPTPPSTEVEEASPKASTIVEEASPKASTNVEEESTKASTNVEEESN
ncbi:hypothetical protein MTO96_049609 [Rhipicephalus appendiculatus]